MPKPTKQLGRFGEYFLKHERNKQKTIGIFSYSKGQTVHLDSTGTSNLKEAVAFLEEWSIRRRKIKASKDMLVLECINTYVIDYANKLPSMDVIRSAIRNLIEVFNEAGPREEPRVTLMVSEFTNANQKKFIAHLRARTKPMDPTNPRSEHVRSVKDSTIGRRLRAIWAAFGYCHGNEELTSFPPTIMEKLWEPEIAARTRLLTLAEVAAILNHCAKSELQWRFALSMLATAGRSAALKEMTESQFDAAHDVMDLNPPGRKQTTKYRPKVPLCWMYSQWVQQWLADAKAADPNWQQNTKGRILTWEGQPLSPRGMFFNKALRKVDKTLVPYHLRHFVSTWLVERVKTEWEKDMFMGHRRPAGGDAQASRVGRDYSHYDPKKMRGAANAIEELFTELQPLVERRLIPFKENRSAGLSLPCAREKKAAVEVPTCQTRDNFYVKLEPADPNSFVNQLVEWRSHRDSNPGLSLERVSKSIINQHLSVNYQLPTDTEIQGVTPRYVTSTCQIIPLRRKTA